MAQSLYTLPNIYYVAGRHYSHNGTVYAPGDVVPDANTFRNIEAMVRSRHLYAAVVNHNDVPKYYQKDVKSFELLEKKLGVEVNFEKFQAELPEDVSTETDEEPVFVPGEHTVVEVVKYVEEHPEEREAVLEAEKADKDRSTLVAQLEVGEL